VGDQSLKCLEIIEDALKHFNAAKEDIVQTRIYIDDDDWEQAAISHKKFFGDLNPANTLIKAGIIGDGLKVEIEAIAVTGD
jgi:enamine deaminase RidA (YjgF/YER057c/UK114 family)